jgi:hypothetical protein
MKKEKEKKIKYLKPVLTKHKKLRDVTAGRSGIDNKLGCTRF